MLRWSSSPVLDESAADAAFVFSVAAATAGLIATDGEELRPIGVPLNDGRGPDIFCCGANDGDGNAFNSDNLALMPVTVIDLSERVGRGTGR